MSGLFDPACQVPVSQQKDGNLVRDCGKVTGYLVSAILTLFVITGVIFAIFTLNSDPVDPNDPKNTPEEKNRNIIIVIAVAVVLELLIWFGIPALMGFFAYNSWEGYQQQISLLEKDGMTHTQALKMVQSYEQAKMQTRALENIAMNNNYGYNNYGYNIYGYNNNFPF